MKKVRYKVSIKGLPTPRGAISFNQLKAITGILSEGAERALRLAIEGQSIKKGPTPAWLSHNTLQKIKQATPEPHAIWVSGFFDAIEHSRRRFQLAMKNGENVRGKIDENLVDVEQMRKLWGQRVTIKGTLYFKH